MLLAKRTSYAMTASPREGQKDQLVPPHWPMVNRQNVSLKTGETSKENLMVLDPSAKNDSMEKPRHYWHSVVQDDRGRARFSDNEPAKEMPASPRTANHIALRCDTIARTGKPE